MHIKKKILIVINFIIFLGFIIIIYGINTSIVYSKTYGIVVDKNNTNYYYIYNYTINRDKLIECKSIFIDSVEHFIDERVIVYYDGCKDSYVLNTDSSKKNIDDNNHFVFYGSLYILVSSVLLITMIYKTERMRSGVVNQNDYYAVEQ